MTMKKKVKKMVMLKILTLSIGGPKFFKNFLDNFPASKYYFFIFEQNL